MLDLLLSSGCIGGGADGEAEVNERYLAIQNAHCNVWWA